MPPPKHRALSAAIVGVSGHGRIHLLLALEQMLQGRIRLEAATVINSGEEAFLCARLRRLGCRIFPSVDAMWAECAGEIDLCCVPTGIQLHAEMTRQALAAGANVLVEKPLAATLEQADQVRAAERQSGRRVFVAFQDMYNETTHAIKGLLCGGGLGRVRRIAITGQWPRDAAYYSRNQWAGRLRTNGWWVLDSPVNNAFAHYLNLALFWSGTEPAISGKPEEIEGELYRTRPIESFDTAALRVTLAAGVRIGMFVTHSCSSDRAPRIVIEGDDGRIEWRKDSHYEICRPNRAPERHPLLDRFESTLAMGDAILRTLAGDPSAPDCGVEIARQHTLVVGALHQSCAIRDVPPSFLHPPPGPTGAMAIDGIDRWIEAAGTRLELFSELGAPWAAPGGRCRAGEVSPHPPAADSPPP